MNTSIVVADIYGVSEKSVTDDLPPGVFSQDAINAAIKRACKRVAGLPYSYRNILQQSASPTVRVPRKPVTND